MVLALALVAPYGGGIAVAAPPVASATPIEVEIQRHAEVGRRHFELGRYQDAIAEYRRAYELKADPAFLYDIAGCYRELGNVERALFFYERYLATNPNAANRDEVEQIIADLEPAQPPPPPERPVPPAANRALLAPMPYAPAPPAADTSRPLWGRWWVWTAIGVVAIGAVAATLAASSGDGALPPTDLGNKRFY